MKAIISGLGALAFLGWTLTGGSGGADVTRVVEKPTQLVYTEMERLFPRSSTANEGVARDGSHHKIEVKVRRSLDESIDYKIELDGKEVLAMNLAFAPEEGGLATRVTGELEVEQELLRFAAAQGGGEAKHMPGFAVDYAMKDMVERMSVALQEGRPLRRDMLFPLLNMSR